ncbi:hypothetical protein AADR41_22785 [Streptomyces sp. CLV115]|uniref:hypothetical protein n=1 Tax=Streptomyces sp. CLV115 TaxID=3138502 RepID=UPI00313F0E69
MSALRAVFASPRPLRRLPAASPVRRDGQELALDAQLLLRLMRIAGRRLVGGPAASGPPALSVDPSAVLLQRWPLTSRPLISAATSDWSAV